MPAATGVGTPLLAPAQMASVTRVGNMYSLHGSNCMVVGPHWYARLPTLYVLMRGVLAHGTHFVSRVRVDAGPCCSARTASSARRAYSSSCWWLPRVKLGSGYSSLACSLSRLGHSLSPLSKTLASARKRTRGSRNCKRGVLACTLTHACTAPRQQQLTTKT